MTKTKIVNVKKKFIEKDGFNNLEEWCENKNNIYIGRKGIVFINKKRYPNNNSFWCNPYKIKDDSREEVIIKYKLHLLELLQTKKIRKDFLSLQGKTLGCWCKPEDCHGDIIIEILDKLLLVNKDSEQDSLIKEEIKNTEKQLKLYKIKKIIEPLIKEENKDDIIKICNNIYEIY